MLPEMSVLENPIVFRPWRPPTAVYPDRNQIARDRDQEYPPTAAQWERIFCINLEGCFFSPGALKEMIVPLGQAVRAGTYGTAALIVVTTDDGTVEFIEALAAKHELPIFLSSSSQEPLANAKPIGALTTAEMQTYGIVRSAGGQVTSSRVANIAGIEVNAAVNRLTSLAKKGYVHRIARPRREGDAFVDLLSVADQTGSAAADEVPPSLSTAGPGLPEDIREGVELVAKLQGSDPREVLVRAWREFVERNRDSLNLESREVRRMLKQMDSEKLIEHLNRHNRERAKQAVSRIKR